MVSNQCDYKTKVGGIFFKSRGLLSEQRSIAIGLYLGYYKNNTEKYKFMSLPLHYNSHNVWVFQ